MSFRHKLFEIHYTLHRAIVSHPAQDESVFEGFESTPTELVFRIVAPSEAMAMLRFEERMAHVKGRAGHQFVQGIVLKHDLDDLLTAVDLN